MPLYDFECNECGRITEEFDDVVPREPKQCPVCHATMRRVFPRPHLNTFFIAYDRRAMTPEQAEMEIAREGGLEVEP